MKKNKGFILLISFLFLSAISYAQILKPAKWLITASNNTPEIGQQIEILFDISIDKDWYLYSNDFDPNLGPQLTEIKFKPNDTYELIGNVQAIQPKKKYSDIFGGDYTYFIEKARFIQKIKILKKDPIIEGSYSYQVCTDVSGKCIPFDADFKINDLKVKATAKKDEKKDKKEEIKKDSVSSTDSKADTSVLNRNDTEALKKSNPKTELSEAKNTVKVEAPQYSLGAFLGLAFLGGLVALLTPCVFPMIPMTVSFFTKRTANRREGIQKALFFGLSIIVIYTTTGTVLSLVLGPTFANELSTAAIPNLIFCAVFIVFALSFLGAFEIVLPASWTNSADKQADKGGYYGIFFMALTLALVSFSCTGPIVGSLLVEASRGGFLKPALGMLAFSTAVALPFTLFAFFPSLLHKLPQSGGWLNSVKVVLGFLELALALKFFSIADQTYHWGLLNRDINIALWIVIFSMMGFYLLGKIQLPHDSKIEKLSISRLMLSILPFAFVVYLIPGLWGAPLKPLAGFLPPTTTLDFDLHFTNTSNIGSAPKLTEKPKYSEILKFPHQLEGFFDYKQGLAYAQKVNKPVFIDFTGHGCVNCREMESRVWSDPEVLRRLKEDYVLIALYVDDRTTVPESDWVVSKEDGKTKKTIGSINSNFQITQFNNNAQPFYCLLDNNGNLLIEPKAYDLNIDSFVKFLDQGKQFYNKKSLVQR